MYYIYVVGLHGLASLYGAYSRSRGEPLHNKLWLQNVIILVNNNLFLLPNIFFFFFNFCPYPTYSSTVTAPRAGCWAVLLLSKHI